MNNPYSHYEQQVLSALYKSINYWEENELSTTEISKAISYIELKKV